MKAFAIAAVSITAVLFIIFIGTVLVWKIVQKNTENEIVIGQVSWIQKAKIPGFKQILFSYTKKGKPCEVISRPIWHKKKYKLKGMYKIKVFYRKAGEKGTIVWADPVSQSRSGQQKRS